MTDENELDTVSCMTDALLDELFSLIDDAAALKKRFAAEAKKRDDVGLALARFEASKEDEQSDVDAAVRAEGSGALLAPLVLAQCLVEDHPYSVIETLQRFADTFPKQATAGLFALLKRTDEKAQTLRAKKKTQDEGDSWARVSVQVAAALAELGETKTAEGLVAAHPELGNTLLAHGIGIDVAIARLEKEEDDDDALREAEEIITILADADVKRAAPAILRYVRSGIFIHAFAALAKLKDERAIEPARTLLRETRGDGWSVDIVRLSAEHVLRAFGEKLPLDLPRSAIHWPIIDYHTNEPEALALRAMAVSALAEQGEAKDKKLAREQLTSPYRVVRAAAKKAFDKEPVLVAWDAGRVAWMKKNSGTKALLDALDDRAALFRHNIVKALAEDSKSKAQVATFIVERIEERMTMPYTDGIELDVDVEVYLSVGEELASGPAKKIFAASKNPWVQVKILGGDEPENTASKRDRPEAAPLQNARVERFDAPPYVFARGFSRLVLAEDAERLLVIGPESFLFDPQAKERLLSLGDGSDVTACAISADGSRFALVRGSKIGVHDGTSGELIGRLEVPGQVTALAFSPDASQIACGTNANILRVLDATSGKEIFDAKAPGTVHGAGWLGPKRAVFLADKAKKSVLVDVDVPKNKTASVVVPYATRLVTCGKWLATAGEKRAAIHDAKLAPKLEVETDEPILDLAIENDKSLLLRLAGSLQRVKLGGKSPRFDGVRNDPVSGLAAAGKRLYAAIGDTLMTFHEDKKAKVITSVHDEHVCSIRRLPDGRVLTNGWDGRILLWKPEGGLAETLVARASRIDEVGVPPEADVVYFGDEHSLRCLDLASRQLTTLVGGDDIEKDVAEHMPEVAHVAASSKHVAWAGSDGVHILDRVRAEEIAMVPFEDVESLAVDASGRFYVGTDDGVLACLDAKGAILWKRVEHGIDMLKGRLYGDPHRSVAYLATHGELLASVGSDDTVRVFDGPKGERLLRCLRPSGIFNTAAFS
ncbi:MAG: repeat-containing protein, partial [Labilithrix sp.]|nr:repeat-containing protein [Labilithrix sp.]